jgi:hypothetical protein
MQRKLFVLFSGLVLLSLMIAPLGPAGAQSPLPPPPSPKNLSPEIEQARARQAMESVLAKYLVYWGPRYQLSLGEVTVDGEWAHGVTEWQSQTKTLSGPIHILAHRSSDGTWQALLPGADGAYLQWLEAMPERLMPASEKSQLRAQAAEANALRRPQTTPAVPPAASVMPLNQGGQGGPIGPISSQAQPTATPTAGASPLQVDESWMKFSNPLLGYSLKYPPNMYYREWNPAVDILHSVSFYLLKDSEQPPWQVPEIEVSIFENPQRLTSMEWILAHLDRLGIKAIEGSAAFFQNVTEIVPMTIDSREALTFNEILGGLSATRVILAHDNIVFSISYTDFGDRKLQAIYWAVVSTLRLSFPFETLSRPVDNSMNHISPSADKQITIILPTSPGYRLPWTGGETYRVAQSWGGSTHTCPGQMCYAYDFDNGGTSFEGVAIRASEGGSVAFIKNDVSPDTCGGYDYRNMANYVTIYHSDGTATLYLHLRQVNVGYGSIGQGTSDRVKELGLPTQRLYTLTNIPELSFNTVNGKHRKTVVLVATPPNPMATSPVPAKVQRSAAVLYTWPAGHQTVKVGSITLTSLPSTVVAGGRWGQILPRRPSASTGICVMPEFQMARSHLVWIYGTTPATRLTLPTGCDISLRITIAAPHHPPATPTLTKWLSTRTPAMAAVASPWASATTPTRDI